MAGDGGGKEGKTERNSGTGKKNGLGKGKNHPAHVNAKE